MLGFDGTIGIILVVAASLGCVFDNDNEFVFWGQRENWALSLFYYDSGLEQTL
jgi:hypothetical protein